MQPNRLGRVLGIGTRIAAEKLRESSARIGTPAPQPAPAVARSGTERVVPSSPAAMPAPAGEVLPPRRQAAPPRPAAAPRPAPVRNYAEGTRRVGRGAGRFSAALLRPFAHATGVLSLQIFGCFFVLFALYFGSHVWKTWQLSGWHDGHLLIYAGIALLFTWFAATSFWRANRKQKAR